MTDRNTMYERLVAVHDFPETYIFKVIGENSQHFISQVVQAAINAMGRDSKIDVSTRASRAGRHISVTLLADVDDAEMVLDIYEMLRVVQGVRFLV